MNLFAEKLNSVLKEFSVYSMLSNLGKRMYTPVGFPEQSQQANREATNFNATAGVAKEYGELIHLDLVKDYFSDSLSTDEIFDYSPMAGKPKLRELWKKDLVAKNPSLKGQTFSLPVVTGGITSSLSTALSLLVDEKDPVVLPQLYWENYFLMINECSGAEMVTFPLLDEKGMDLKAFESAIDSIKTEKITVILNFPNNPTGYTPTVEEAQKIKEILVKRAESGKKLVVMLDDAYFSLFYEENVCRESLFAYLCNAHENLLAVKLDGPTKEEMVWGFRIGFITFGCKGLSKEAINALEQKTVGIIRCNISSCNTAAQSILIRILQDPRLEKERLNAVEKVRRHYKAIKAVLDKYKAADSLTPMPFNSGYFVTFRTKCNAEQLRLTLLDVYKGGIIRIDDHTIRFAYCSIDPEKMEETVDLLYSVASSLV